MILGYARVSTADQDLASQLEALQIAGAENIFHEKQSGAKADRPQLRIMIGSLQRGDVVMVTALDRLSRSMRDLLNILEEIAERGATFRSLREAWCDSTTPMGQFLITVLGGIAQLERHLIKSRTDEGRKRAQAAGVKFGAPVKVTPEQREEILQRFFAGGSQTAVAKIVGLNRTTVKRVIDAYQPHLDT